MGSRCRCGSGEVGALVGPSGCGKTTLLRIIAGLDRDYEGSITLPDHGRLGVVFQEPRLLPWRTLEQNVRLAAPGGERRDARGAVPHARARSPSQSLSRRTVARTGATRGARARVCGRARSAAARRAVRFARRCAGGAVARRAGRAGDAPSGHDAAGDAQCRRGDRTRRPAVFPVRQPGARHRRGADRAPAREAHRGGAGSASRRDRAEAQSRPAAPCGGSCRAAGRSRRSRAGRTARSSRTPPPSPPARTDRRAQSGSSPPRG